MDHLLFEIGNVKNVYAAAHNFFSASPLQRYNVRKLGMPDSPFKFFSVNTRAGRQKLIVRPIATTG
jgi:hypothetical protein